MQKKPTSEAKQSRNVGRRSHAVWSWAEEAERDEGEQMREARRRRSLVPASQAPRYSLPLLVERRLPGCSTSGAYTRAPRDGPCFGSVIASPDARPCAGIQEEVLGEESTLGFNTFALNMPVQQTNTQQSQVSATAGSIF